jgi:hypothetical protein
VNASTSALPREDQVQTKIRKIRQFSRSARTLCAAMFGFGLVGIAVGLFVILFVRVPAPQSSDGGAFDVLTSPLTPPLLKAWWLIGMGAVVGVSLAAVLQFHRLFGSLAAGEIYTPGNVQRVRHIGLLWLALAVLHFVLPPTLMVANGMLHVKVAINFAGLFPPLGESLSSFAAAGLVLLVSWIMDVGLYEKQHADALRRDADLVI